MRNGPNEWSLPDAHPADRKIHAGPIHAQKNLNGVGTMFRPVEGDRCDHAARTDTPRRRQENPLDKKSLTNLKEHLSPKRREAVFTRVRNARKTEDRPQRGRATEPSPDDHREFPIFWRHIRRRDRPFDSTLGVAGPG